MPPSDRRAACTTVERRRSRPSPQLMLVMAVLPSSRAAMRGLTVTVARGASSCSTVRSGCQGPRLMRARPASASTLTVSPRRMRGASVSDSSR